MIKYGFANFVSVLFSLALIFIINYLFDINFWVGFILAIFFYFVSAFYMAKVFKIGHKKEENENQSFDSGKWK